TSNSSLLEIAADSPTDVWAVGALAAKHSFKESPLIEHFDGTQWVSSPPASSSAEISELTSVSIIAPDDIWAAGLTAFPGEKPLIEHFDGSTWTVVKAPSTNKKR